MAGQGNGNGNGNGRSVEAKVAAALQVAFVHALKRVQYSEARASGPMRCSRSNVERYKSGESEVNAKYPLHSKRMWRPFWLCLGREMRKVHGTSPRFGRVRRAR